MERDPFDVADQVSYIVVNIQDFDDVRLATRMGNAFGWCSFALNHPDMTAEEIASAAADVKGSV